MDNRPPAVTQQETIDALLKRSKRRFVPIRRSFLQQGKSAKRIPGPLAGLVRRGDERGLDQYLLVHAAASAEPYDVTLAASAWARALGLPDGRGAKSSASAVSKVLKRLEDARLIQRKRHRGRCQITLLDEGGTAAPYKHPKDKRESYFKLPYEYWEEGWAQRLKMPAKVAFLIALSLSDGFKLPVERGPDWYGVSPDTVQRGLAALGEAGLINVAIAYQKMPLAPKGYTQARHFTLRAPFAPGRKRSAKIISLIA
ncbi:MAG: hypothetical protein AAF799_48145 [Myxococcota bacterium]